MGKLARPSVIGRAHGALVAINGDFGLLTIPDPPVPDGRDPDGPGRAEPGRASRSPTTETAAFVGPPPAGRRRAPRDGERRLPRSRGGTHIVPRTARSRRSRGTGEASIGLPTTGARRGSTRTGRWDGRRSRPECSRRYTVDVVRCVSRPGGSAPEGRARVEALGPGADTIEAMPPRRSRPPLLVDRVAEGARRGRWHAAASSTAADPSPRGAGRRGPCRRNPRTGIGVTSDGRLLLVVVDGRSRRSDIGADPATVRPHLPRPRSRRGREPRRRRQLRDVDQGPRDRELALRPRASGRRERGDGPARSDAGRNR